MPQFAHNAAIWCSEPESAIRVHSAGTTMAVESYLQRRSDAGHTFTAKKLIEAEARISELEQQRTKLIELVEDFARKLQAIQGRKVNVWSSWLVFNAKR